MSRLGIGDMFYGKPESGRSVAGGGSGGYGGYQAAGPHYYSDGEDYYSHSHSGRSGRAPEYPSSATGRPILPDVKLSVPMDSFRCVEKVKEALDISGVYSVYCDIPSQTVTVSANVEPQALLKRVKHVKRKSKIVSYNNSGHMAGNSHHGRTSSASSASEHGIMAAPGYGSSAGSTYYNYRQPGRLPSPPRDAHSYSYSRNNHHTFSSLGDFNDHYRPSHDRRLINYY